MAIASGVVFATHYGAAWIFREDIPDTQVFGPIIIEDNCVIGQNVVLFPRIRIGRNSIVGAGSVIISDVPPNTIAMGVPAWFKKYNASNGTNYMISHKWYPWDGNMPVHYYCRGLPKPCLATRVLGMIHYRRLFSKASAIPAREVNTHQ